MSNNQHKLSQALLQDNNLVETASGSTKNGVASNQTHQNPSEDVKSPVVDKSHEKNSTSREPFSKPACYKIIVLGEAGVGKTSLSYRFCSGKFPTSSEPTIGLDFREKIVELDGMRLKLQLWDTAGQERFRRGVTHHYFRGTNAVVLVYDVGKESTLPALDHWLEELESHNIGPDIPRVVVGNKCDQGSQEVNTAVAQRWADDRGMALFETSAKDDSLANHVDSIFLTLAHKLKNKKSLIKPVADPNHPDQEPVRLVYKSNLVQQAEQSQSCCF